MLKKYYKIAFTLTEPMSLGNGENQYSDCDLLRDNSGQPFIPGSSLCGCYRAAVGEALANKYFGSMESDGSTKESRVVVYDAVLTGKCRTAIRDSVGLDEFKTGKIGAKFDFEMVEPGATFVTYIEQTFAGDDEEEEADVGKIIARAYLSGNIYLGRKTLRGYGNIHAVNVYSREFLIKSADGSGQQKQSEHSKRTDDLDEWLDFDLFANDAFGKKEKDNAIKELQSVPISDAEGKVCIKLSLKLRDGISVRKYTTILADGKGDEQPDYEQMYYKDDNGGKVPCIPGTSWAGAFRHQMEGMLPLQYRDDIMRDYFGTCMKKSNVRFSESCLRNGKWKINTRNAIDRFTGGTVNGALYTENTYYGGKTELIIQFTDRDDEEGVLWKKALSAAITDLDQGFLAVGGLTAVGRGLFEVENCTVNGKEIYSGKKNSERIIDGCTPNLYHALNDCLIKEMGADDEQ